MNPVKLMYNIKLKVDKQIDESNGKAREEDDADQGVKSNGNFYRFKDGYLVKPRDDKSPLPEIQEGAEYKQNVQLIGKMLNHHQEFQEAMNRKINIVASGEKINTAAMNPVMLEKVADVIRQLDDQNSPNQNFVAN